MSILKENLIKILEQNHVDYLCSVRGFVNCDGVGCIECPFGSTGNKQRLIKELQND